ncbi:MAG TPA: hypothetical protein VHF58_00485 [Solirubrobacterales bacterium]|nr:hypothetical protein [Solirubrobacterales bacterium]
MRKTAWRTAATLASVAVVAGAGSVLAGEGDQGPGQTAEPSEVRKVTAERVSAARAARAVPTVAARKAKRQRKPELVYLETEPQTLVPGPTGFRIGNCPRRSNAINGYYYMGGTQQGFGLDNQGDSPIKGLRQWAFYLDSASGASNVTFGLVCLKNVRVR